MHHDQIRATLLGSTPWVPAELTIVSEGGAEVPQAETMPERLRQMHVSAPPQPERL